MKACLTLLIIKTGFGGLTLQRIRLTAYSAMIPLHANWSTMIFGFKYILILFEDQEKNYGLSIGAAVIYWIFMQAASTNPMQQLSEPIILPVKQVNTDNRFLMEQWEDAKRALWLATDVGLFSLDPSQPDENKAWKHWENIPGNNSSLSDNKIISLYPDPHEPQKFLWLGTRGSDLNRFEMATGNVIRFTKKTAWPIIM